MKLFSRIIAESALYCSVCQCAYKPRDYGRFTDMCLTCAKEPIERENRKDVVRRYAEANWEKLECAAKKWEAERLNAYANMAAVYQQQGTSY